MEGDNVDVSVSGGAGGGSRWNPTKEQIDMLEGLYNQGIRTPSAEQIQQMTNRLRAFGHIEGKNVFYWFQNHKARQRQKQKQENVSYFNRFLHKTPGFPPCPSVVCSPFYIPYTDLGFSQRHPKVLLPPRGLKRRPVRENFEATKLNGRAFSEPAYQDYNILAHCSNANQDSIDDMKSCNDHQTLDLFPQQPSGNLQSRTESSCLACTSVGYSTTPLSSSDTKFITDQEASGQHCFFDFFCGKGPCESH